MDKPKCKRCGYELGLLTAERRVELHRKVLAALDKWRETPASARDTEAVRYAMADATVWAEYIVAGDQGLCIMCASTIERPTP